MVSICNLSLNIAAVPPSFDSEPLHHALVFMIIHCRLACHPQPANGSAPPGWSFPPIYQWIEKVDGVGYERMFI